MNSVAGRVAGVRPQQAGRAAIPPSLLPLSHQCVWHRRGPTRAVPAAQPCPRTGVIYKVVHVVVGVVLASFLRFGLGPRGIAVGAALLLVPRLRKPGREAHRGVDLVACVIDSKCVVLPFFLLPPQFHLLPPSLFSQ